MEGKQQVLRTGLNPGMVLRLGDRYLYPPRGRIAPTGAPGAVRRPTYVYSSTDRAAAS